MAQQLIIKVKHRGKFSVNRPLLVKNGEIFVNPPAILEKDLLITVGSDRGNALVIEGAEPASCCLRYTEGRWYVEKTGSMPIGLSRGSKSSVVKRREMLLDKDMVVVPAINLPTPDLAELHIRIAGQVLVPPYEASPRRRESSQRRERVAVLE